MLLHKSDFVHILLKTAIDSLCRLSPTRLLNSLTTYLINFGTAPAVTLAHPKTLGSRVIPSFFGVSRSRTHAAMANRCFGVNPHKAILGRS